MLREFRPLLHTSPRRARCGGTIDIAGNPHLPQTRLRHLRPGCWRGPIPSSRRARPRRDKPRKRHPPSRQSSSRIGSPKFGFPSGRCACKGFAGDLRAWRGIHLPATCGDRASSGPILKLSWAQAVSYGKKAGGRKSAENLTQVRGVCGLGSVKWARGLVADPI